MGALKDGMEIEDSLNRGEGLLCTSVCAYIAKREVHAHKAWSLLWERA